MVFALSKEIPLTLDELFPFQRRHTVRHVRRSCWSCLLLSHIIRARYKSGTRGYGHLELLTGEQWGPRGGFGLTRGVDERRRVLSKELSRDGFLLLIARDVP